MSEILLREYIRDFIFEAEENEAEDNNQDQTIDNPFEAVSGSNFDSIGDFKKAVEKSLKSFKSKKKKDFAKSAANLGLDMLVPYYSAASNGLDIIRKMYKTKDNNKSNTFLDKFNIDDDLSKIVDDELEEDFLNYLLEKDDISLESMNINKLLQNYLASNYNKRTVDIKK